jgi:tetraacyldisaccharide 4'-kinase
MVESIIAPAPPRSPWQLFYGMAHRWRRRYYRSRARRLPHPVISIGNLHWGGTGKTPMVESIARHLRDRKLAVAILSRGYGRRDAGIQIVSDGEGPLLGPLVAGDEPVLLAGDLPGVAVVVGPDRYRAGRDALERLTRTPDLFLLDDGFSHLALKRDLDILVFPASDPFAGGRLPPAGRLREPLASAARAHAVVLTAAEAGDGEALAEALRIYGFTGPGFASVTRPEHPRTAQGKELEPGTRVIAVAGIARPERFLAAARDFQMEIVDSLLFSDHFSYPPRTLDKLVKRLHDANAQYILTTGKDFVKLYGRLDAPLANLMVRAEPEPGFWRWLDEHVDPLLPR